MSEGRLSQSSKSVRRAGLRYVSHDKVAGIMREGAPGRFRYRAPSGRLLRDKATLERIRALAIPPAWTKVWIAPYPNAHLAATGMDAKGRKQYRYHPAFTALRDAAKFEHLAKFGASLPKMRRRLRRDLARKGMPRERVLAAIVTLLEESLIRIGNEDYARTNHSFGLTTLRNRHVRVRGEQFTFLFQGKSGKTWNLSLRDRRVARVIRSCQELPGQHLFEYRSAEGAIHAVSSCDVNAYLRQISGCDISAKDFRTWAGTVRAARLLAAQKGKPAKRAVRDVVAQVAKALGNTVAVCRKCYIHPKVIARYEAGRLRLPRAAKSGFGAGERAVLSFLRGPSLPGVAAVASEIGT